MMDDIVARICGTEWDRGFNVNCMNWIHSTYIIFYQEFLNPP